MSELALAPQRKVLSYVIGAFSAPRLTVKQLMAEPAVKTLSWQLVLVSASVSALSSAVSNYYDRGNPGNTTFFLPENYPVAEMIFWGGLEFAIYLALFLFTRFLWRYLFGFREEENAVWAAAALSSCPAIILDPLLEVTFLATNDEIAPYAVVFGAYTLISTSIIAVYFSAALAIPYVKAAVLALCNTVIFFIAAMAIVFAIALVPTLLSIPASS